MNITGAYHKAIVAAVAGGLVAAISVITGAMTPADTFGDIPAVTWLLALSAFLVGSGVTGGAVAVSRANTRLHDVRAVAQHITDQPQEAVGGASAPARNSPVGAETPTYENPSGQKG